MSNATKLTTPSDREIRTERVFKSKRAHVWRAFTDPKLVAQWWGRGNKLVIERMEVERGGHWRFVEHTPDGETHGFEGRYREVTPIERIVQTFEWDGMPGHVVVETVILEDLGDSTRVINLSLFHTNQERDGMMQSGMEQGLNEGYAALDKLLEKLG